MAHPFKLRQLLQIPLIVANLRFFVEIYDLLLFSIVQVPSLQYLGVTGEQLLEDVFYLINMQIGGMLLGCVMWGAGG